MANYPLITWETEFPAFDVQVGVSAAVPISAGAGYGFELATTPNIASTGSAAGYFAQQLDTVAGISATSAVFEIVSSTIPATSPLRATITYTCASPIVVTFATDADAAVYGFASTTVNLLSGTGANVTTTFNVGAVWCPCGVAGDVRRTTVQRAAASSSEMSGLSTDVVNWGKVANLEFLSSIFPAANLTRWYAQIDVFYDAAQRDKDDPNNTLEGLLEAAATGVTFRLYRQPSDLPAGTSPQEPNEARMPLIAERSAVADYAQADDEPRLWSTSGMFFRGNT